MEGYIYLWRSLKDKAWFVYPKTVHLFVHLLLSASHKPREQIYRKKVVNLCEGSYWTTLARLARETKMSIKSVRTSLEHLKSTNTVACLCSPQGMVIVLNNWNEWQSPANKRANEGQMKGKSRANEGHQNNTLINESNEIKGFVDFPNSQSLKQYPQLRAVTEFKAFWNLYPDKKNRPGDEAKVMAIWDAKKYTQEEVTHILKAVEIKADSEDWTKNKRQFMPRPEKFLIEEKWKDVEIPKVLYTVNLEDA